MNSNGALTVAAVGLGLLFLVLAWKAIPAVPIVIPVPGVSR